MEVHGRPGILPGLQRVDKLFGDGLAKAYVVAAAAPEPAVPACGRGNKHLASPSVKELASIRIRVHVALTPLSVPAVVAPAVVKVAQTAVPG